MKKNVRMLVSLLLCMILMFMTACATKPEPEPAAQPEQKQETTPAEQTTETVPEGKSYVFQIACDNEAYRAENIIKAAERLTEQLAAEGSKDEVVAEYLLIESDFENTMAMYSQSGDLPELMVGNMGKVNNCALAGLLLEADEVVYGDVYSAEVAPNLQEMGRGSDGKLYGVIQDIETRPVWFYIPALEKLGYTEADMEQLKADFAAGKITYTELQELAKRSVDEGITEYGILHRPSNGAEFRNVFFNFCDGEVAPVDDKGIIIVDKSACYDFLNYMRQSVKLGLTPADMTTTSWSVIEGDLWPNGKTLCWFGGIWNKGDMMVSGGVTGEYVDENYLLTPMPVVEEGNTSRSLSNPQFYAMTTAAKEDAKLYEYIKRVLEIVLDPDIQINSTVPSAHLAIGKSTLEYDEYKAETFLSDNAYLLEYSFVQPQNPNLGKLTGGDMYAALQAAEMTDDDLNKIVETWINNATFQMDAGSFTIVD